MYAQVKSYIVEFTEDDSMKQTVKFMVIKYHFYTHKFYSLFHRNIFCELNHILFRSWRSLNSYLNYSIKKLHKEVLEITRGLKLNI